MEGFKKHLSSLDTDDFGHLVNLSCMALNDDWEDGLTIKDFLDEINPYAISTIQALNCILLELANRWGNLVDG